MFVTAMPGLRIVGSCGQPHGVVLNRSVDVCEHCGYTCLLVCSAFTATVGNVLYGIDTGYMHGIHTGYVRDTYGLRMAYIPSIGLRYIWHAVATPNSS